MFTIAHGFSLVVIPDMGLRTREAHAATAQSEFPQSGLLTGQAVVHVGSLEQAEYDRALGVRGAALLFEVATNGAGDAVFIHLADVLE
jgi:hypothetical protein